MWVFFKKFRIFMTLPPCFSHKEEYTNFALSFRQTAMIPIRRAHIAHLRFDKGFLCGLPALFASHVCFLLFVCFSPLSAEKSFFAIQVSFPIFRNARRFFQTPDVMNHTQKCSKPETRNQPSSALYCRSPPQRCAMLRADSHAQAEAFRAWWRAACSPACAVRR